MEKLDVKRTEKHLYSGRNGKWEEIVVPPMTYLSVTGEGDPEGPAYAAAVEALYSHAYPLKFESKAAGRDYVVPPLEALWWAEDPRDFVAGRRDRWRWKALLRVPVPASPAALEAAYAKAARKLGPSAPSVTMEEIDEGPCLQCLHVGSYADEAPVLAHLHEEVMPSLGVTFGQPHHEIYLADPRRTAPEKLRTILRQPVVPVGS